MENLTNSAADFPICCLKDAAFYSFFQKLIEEKNIVEYYLADDRGSFLLQDFEGNLSLLVVKDEKEMRATAEIAASSVSKELAEGINNRTQILYLHEKEDSRLLSPKEWELKNYFHPAACIKGEREKYYYYAHKFLKRFLE